MTRRRARSLSALMAAGILVAGVGLAVVDSLRYRTDLRADTLERVQSEADQVAGALTQISRESRTLAAASRDHDAFVATVDEVRSRNDAVVGAMVLDDWRMRDVTIPSVPAGILQMLGIRDGAVLPVDDALPSLAAPLRSVLEDGGLLLAGPLPADPLPMSLTLIVDRAPAVEGVPDQRLLLLLLDIEQVLAALPPAGPGRPLDTAILLDGGTGDIEGIEDIGPRVVRGDADVFDDGVQARADVAGVTVAVAGRPTGGWPLTSPAAPLILLPTVLGAGLGWLTVERRRTERTRLHERVETATADVRRARAREQATIEHSPDGLLGLDDDVVVSANPAAAALIGVPRHSSWASACRSCWPSTRTRPPTGPRCAMAAGSCWCAPPRSRPAWPRTPTVGWSPSTTSPTNAAAPPCCAGTPASSSRSTRSTTSSRRCGATSWPRCHTRSGHRSR